MSEETRKKEVEKLALDFANEHYEEIYRYSREHDISLFEATCSVFLPLALVRSFSFVQGYAICNLILIEIIGLIRDKC